MVLIVKPISPRPSSVVYSYDLPPQWIFYHRPEDFTKADLPFLAFKRRFSSLCRWLEKYPPDMWELDWNRYDLTDNYILNGMISFNLKLQIDFLDDQLACLFRLNITPELNFDHLI